ncbi:hypothetical protein SUZIE_109275 [Sciurus carolinensis]|uniref:Uncharacterized protein n=1 Tax=Sciurus carolinensis TaxID=30640 RepID=A0AA41SRU9_SCICA|nr:hypothetical protein [Sciurus carolinensis]
MDKKVMIEDCNIALGMLHQKRITQSICDADMQDCAKFCTTDIHEPMTIWHFKTLVFNPGPSDNAKLSKPLTSIRRSIADSAICMMPSSCFRALTPPGPSWAALAAVPISHLVERSGSSREQLAEPALRAQRPGVAFLLMDAKECIMSTEEIFLTKIEKFINIHQNSFLVLFAALHGPEEWKLMFRIQQRFLGSNLRILPVHNTVNAINLMCTVAKTTSKPYIDSICYRMVTTKAYIIEQSPVWKTLQKIKLGRDAINPN